MSLDDLSRDLGQVSAKASKRVGAALGKSADAARDEARRNLSANLSPRFADAVHSRREASGPPAAYLLVDDEHADVINAWEVGTARHGPRPSIAPAVESKMAGLDKAVGDALRDLL